MDETRLSSIELFESLPADARRAIAQHADELDIPEGTELARQGDFAYEFFVIEDGTASGSPSSAPATSSVRWGSSARSCATRRWSPPRPRR